jgi:hypothetical protein
MIQDRFQRAELGGAKMVATLDHIKRWCIKADEVRALAATARDPFRRQHFLTVVETYETLVNEARAQMRLKIYQRQC